MLVMAAKDVGDQLVETIMEWGVDTVFGLPGDGINGIIESFRQRKDSIKFIQVRHEEAAAFMACAHGKYTGKLGCCLATSGPGAIHLLNGLYDAKMDHSPVLAITGMTYHDLIGQQYQQDVDTQALFRDVAIFDERIMGPGDVRALTNLACREALYNQGVAHLTFPVDLQVESVEGDGRSERNVPGHTSSVMPRLLPVPAQTDLIAAAKILNEARRPLILAGAGALGAGDILLAVADKLGAPVVKALLGKGVIPDEHPLCLGGLGLLGTRPSEDAMEECDAILMVGTSFPYMSYLPKPGQAKGVQIEHSPGRMGLRYPIDVGLLGDARLTLQLLEPMLEKKTDRRFLHSIQKEVKKWWETLEDRETRTDMPMKPQVVAKALNDLIDNDAIISTDSGTITAWVARHLRIKENQMFSCSGNLATMAPGLPYSIAAKAAYPDRQSIAFVGDGGFTMLMGEFATAVKYNLPIKVIIIKNNVLGQIKWEQIVFLGNPEYVVELQPIDFVKFAEACGGVGFHVERPEDVKDVLKEALMSNKPAIVEAVVDPNEPPMPAKIKAKQATKFAEALLRGQPQGPRIALTLFRDKVDELIH
jgi:pyruvate dehydrogenase (quinone)/pyruvate oxidase